MSEPDFCSDGLGKFLADLSSDSPAPGGGAAAAVSLAMAAGLVAMAARFSSAQLPEAGPIAERADSLRSRAAALADADALAYVGVLEALALPREPEPAARAGAVREALSHAAQVPLEIAENAVEIARLASRLSAGGNPNLRGDAGTSAVLAAAAARAAALLVKINLARQPDDTRPTRAARLAEECEQLAAAATS
ncbi:MAG: cyclodeaminase/cyclohydrolase family protein [Acidimicrobiales bacterium]